MIWDVYVTTPAPISERLREQYGEQVGDWPTFRADEALPHTTPHEAHPMGGRWWTTPPDVL